MELAIVRHEPQPTALSSWLVTGDFALEKGGVAQLEGEPEPAGMRLCTLLTPRVLRR